MQFRFYFAIRPRVRPSSTQQLKDDHDNDGTTSHVHSSRKLGRSIMEDIELTVYHRIIVQILKMNMYDPVPIYLSERPRLSSSICAGVICLLYRRVRALGEPVLTRVLLAALPFKRRKSSRCIREMDITGNANNIRGSKYESTYFNHNWKHIYGFPLG